MSVTAFRSCPSCGKSISRTFVFCSTCKAQLPPRIYERAALCYDRLRRNGTDARVREEAVRAIAAGVTWIKAKEEVRPDKQSTSVTEPNCNETHRGKPQI